MPLNRLVVGFAGLLPILVASAGAQRPASVLPAVPTVHGNLTIQVAYPAAGGAVDAGDSTFLFGTECEGAAKLPFAGKPVGAAPKGAGRRWKPIPGNSSLCSRSWRNAVPTRRPH